LDPNGDVADFQPNWKRSRGPEFGERPLVYLFSCHGLKTLDRGHSFLLEGV
jgi:hypothetical protein